MHRGKGTWVSDPETERWRGEVTATLASIKREIQIRADHADRAITIASDALTVRLDHANGLIQKMDQQSRDFASSESVRLIEKQVGLLQQADASTSGRRSVAQVLMQMGMLLLGAALAFVISKLSGGAP